MLTPHCRGCLLHEPVGGCEASNRPVPQHLGRRFERKRLAVRVQYERSRSQSLVLALPAEDNENPVGTKEQINRNSAAQQQQQQPSRVLVSYEEDYESIDYVPYAKSQAPLTKINVDLMLVSLLC